MGPSPFHSGRFRSSSGMAGSPQGARTAGATETRDSGGDRSCLRGVVVVSYPPVADGIGEPEPCVGGEEAARSPAQRRNGRARRARSSRH